MTYEARLEINLVEGRDLSGVPVEVLKPCPWCKSTDITFEPFYENFSWGGQASCNGCYAGGPWTGYVFDCESDAIDASISAWNRLGVEPSSLLNIPTAAMVDELTKRTLSIDIPKGSCGLIDGCKMDGPLKIIVVQGVENETK